MRSTAVEVEAATRPREAQGVAAPMPDLQAEAAAPRAESGVERLAAPMPDPPERVVGRVVGPGAEPAAEAVVGPMPDPRGQLTTASRLVAAGHRHPTAARVAPPAASPEQPVAAAWRRVAAEHRHPTAAREAVPAASPEQPVAAAWRRVAARLLVAVRRAVGPTAAAQVRPLGRQARVPTAVPGASRRPFRSTIRSYSVPHRAMPLRSGLGGW